MIQIIVHNFLVACADLCWETAAMMSTLSASHCPSAGTQIVSLSLALHFSTSPCKSNQTFQGVVTPLFINSRGEEAGNDPFPSLSVTIHLGWGWQGCVTLARSPPLVPH